MARKRKISIKALGLGVLCYVMTSIVIGLIVGFGFSLTGGTPDQISAFLKGGPMLVVNLGLGAIMTFAVGALAAHLAWRAKLLNAACTGALCALIGLPFAIGLPWWYILVFAVECVPFSMAGGWVIQNHNRVRRLFV